MCTSQRSSPPAVGSGGVSDPTPESLQGERKLPSCIIIGNILPKIPIFDTSTIVTISTITITTIIINVGSLKSRCAKRRNKGSPRDALAPPGGQDGTTGSPFGLNIVISFRMKQIFVFDSSSFVE